MQVELTQQCLLQFAKGLLKAKNNKSLAKRTAKAKSKNSKSLLSLKLKIAKAKQKVAKS